MEDGVENGVEGGVEDGVEGEWNLLKVSVMSLFRCELWHLPSKIHIIMRKVN